MLLFSLVILTQLGHFFGPLHHSLRNEWDDGMIDAADSLLAEVSKSRVKIGNGNLLM